MKKAMVIVAFIALTVLLGSTVFAQDVIVTSDLVNPPVVEPVPVPVVITPTPVSPVVVPITQPFSFPGLNLQGDTLYFPTLGVFAAGIGTDIATFYDILSIRAEATVVSQENSANMAGVGLGINIPKLIEKAGGTWMLKGFTSSIGVLGMVSFTAPVKIYPAIYVTILKITF